VPRFLLAANDILFNIRVAGRSFCNTNR